MVKRSLRIVLYCLLALAFVQYAIAFGYPHYTEGEKFCWVQAWADEQSRLISNRWRLYELRSLEHFIDISLGTTLYINGSNRYSPSLPYSQIYFGYTDGYKLYGCSFKRFTYYLVDEDLTVKGGFSEGRVLLGAAFAQFLDQLTFKGDDPVDVQSIQAGYNLGHRAKAATKQDIINIVTRNPHWDAKARFSKST